VSYGFIVENHNTHNAVQKIPPIRVTAFKSLCYCLPMLSKYLHTFAHILQKTCVCFHR